MGVKYSLLTREFVECRRVRPFDVPDPVFFPAVLPDCFDKDRIWTGSS